jgi:hypothetical protein
MAKKKINWLLIAPYLVVIVSLFLTWSETYFEREGFIFARREAIGHAGTIILAAFIANTVFTFLRKRIPTYIISALTICFSAVIIILNVLQTRTGTIQMSPDGSATVTGTITADDGSIVQSVTLEAGFYVFCAGITLLLIALIISLIKHKKEV